MKINPIKLIALTILMIVMSCNEPETVVTNYVYPDGSVTRKIEMRNLGNKFNLADLQVPFDSTWIVKDSIEITGEGDTIWVKRAEKLFKNVEEINLTYKNDSGANKEISRRAAFKKKFKWFNTEYRFSETIDRKLAFGYLISDFLNKEELLFFYSPYDVNNKKKNSCDSLRYRALNDTVSKKVDMWSTKNLVSGWIKEFSRLAIEKEGGQKAVESMKSREDELVRLVNINDKKIDSLWSNGIILKEYMGDADYEKFKSEADTAIAKAAEQFWVHFKEYSVRISMPGEVIGTNGFIDSTGVLLWPVKSDYFLTEPYIMWAESKIPNRWAWVVSGLFLVFVLTGVIIKNRKKG